jgi:hypothetical protein
MSALRPLALSLRRVTTILVFTALTVAWALQITGRPVEDDAAQNVAMAVNLAHHGMISLDDRPPLTPSNYREPLPVAVLALGIKLIDAVLGRAEPSAYLSGERVRLLKYQNVAWLLLLAAGTLWVTQRLTASFTLGIVAVLLVSFPFLGHGGAEYVDDLYTDLPAAAALVWASGALARAFVTRRWGWIAAAGVLFGVLTLIKAATLYVFAGLAFAWLLTRLWRGAAVFEPGARAVAEVSVLLAAFGCTIVPWMLRNKAELGSFELSQRAGIVLLYRALHDEMTPREIAGAFYAWAPQGLKRPLGMALGFTPADLERGGALQRLNDGDSNFAAQDLAAEKAGRPDQAISFYRQARADRNYWEGRLADEHRAQPDIDADAILKARALSIIEAHPLKHLAITPVFIWRGAAKSFVFLAVGLLLAVIYRRDDLGAFVLPAFGLVLLYALGTQFVPRYGVPPRPVAAVVIVFAARLLWARFAPRRATSARRAQVVGR